MDYDLARGAAILCALGSLSEKQRFAFVCHKVNGDSLATVGRGLGVTKQYARQLVDQAQNILDLDLALWRDRMAA